MRSATRVRAFRLEYAPHPARSTGERGYPAGATVPYGVVREARPSSAMAALVTATFAGPGPRYDPMAMWCFDPPPPANLGFAFERAHGSTPWIEYSLPLQTVTIWRDGRLLQWFC